ncbi:MAG: nucleoside phosphorylase [Chloroflexi bacterium]|nr:MAG: nucleoside phosphorylase [Chloroflexota bacterium]
MSEVLPATKIPRSGLPAHAIVVGDPRRAALTAAMLENSCEIGSNREYVTYRGTWKGLNLTISSHGVGGPGAMIMFQELTMAGARTIIRAGTCGAVVPQIEDGDIVIATATVRDDGVTDQMVPPSFPGFSTPEVVLALQKAAQASGHTWHRGIVWTKSLFFPGVLKPPYELYIQAGVIAVEMELSALLVLASLKGLQSGGILVCDGNPTKRSSQAEYNPHRPIVESAIVRMMEITLNAMHDLAETREA